MAARDNVLFQAAVSSGSAAGTVIPLSVLHGVANVRQGYGKPVLKSARAIFNGCYTSPGFIGIPIEIQNSNWVEPAGLTAQAIAGESVLASKSLAYMPGRDKELIPNTSWNITATLAEASTAAGNIYVLLEIEYADVPGVDAEKLTGSPVMKKCSSTVTATANTLTSLGTFDNLLQSKTYVLAEASIQIASSVANGVCFFVVLDSFSNQRGLTRIIPVREFGMAEEVKGSVYLLKQTYTVGLISSVNLTAQALDVAFEMIVNTN